MGPGEVGNLYSVIPKPGIRMGLDGHPLVLDVRPVRGLVEDVGGVGITLIGATAQAIKSVGERAECRVGCVSNQRKRLKRCLKEGNQGAGLCWSGQQRIGMGPDVGAFGMNNCDVSSVALTNKKLIRLWHSKGMAHAMLSAETIPTESTFDAGLPADIIVSNVFRRSTPPTARTTHAPDAADAGTNQR